MQNEIMIIVADESSIGTLLSVARETESPITAIVAGSREQAEQVAQAGVASVKWLAINENTPVEAYADTIAEMVQTVSPRVVLTTNTTAPRVILGVVAARIDAATTAFVTKVTLKSEKTIVERSIAERRAIESVETIKPVAALVLEGSDDLLNVETAAPIEELSSPTTSNLKIIATYAETGGGANLADAERVVGAGRGILSKEELLVVEEFAQALNAEMACSLSLCDDYRWYEHARVVGTSTQRISPRLYISVGVSGQPQHMTGVRGAKTIVAINNDPEAPIFRGCSYGIVGDLNKVVPALTAALAEQ